MTIQIMRSGIFGCRCNLTVPDLVRWLAVGIAVVCAVWMGAPVKAASLSVSPLLIEIDHGQKTAGVRVSNLNLEHAVNMQARLFRWQQVDGQDVYSDAETITLSPPLTRIAPGRENLIRLVLTGAPPAQGEASYRLILDELPDALQSEQQSGVSLLIRQLIPVFVSAPNARPAEPEWQVGRVNPGDGSPSGYRVTVRNLGDRRLRLSQLSLTDEDGVVLAQNPGLVGYVLGQSQMNFLISDVEGAPAAPAAVVLLTAKGDGGEFSTGPLPVRPGA